MTPKIQEIRFIGVKETPKIREPRFLGAKENA